jgi:hypothetical protein
MKRWGRVLPAAVLGCAVLAVAGCNPDEVVVGTREASDAWKAAHEVHIPGNEVQHLADQAAVTADTLGETAQRVAETRPWQEIRAQIQDMDETSRAIVVATACDMLFQKLQRKRVDAVGDLEENAAAAGVPPSQEFLNAANDAYTVLFDDHATGDDTDKAAVSAGCYVVDQEFKVMFS